MARKHSSRPNPKSTPKEIVGSHGHKSHGPSILWPALYEHLRAKGKTKAAAAAISNAAWKKKRMGIPTNTPMSARGLAKGDPSTDAVNTGASRQFLRANRKAKDEGRPYVRTLTAAELRQRKDAAASSGRKRKGKGRSRREEEFLREAAKLPEGERKKVATFLRANRAARDAGRAYIEVDKAEPGEIMKLDTERQQVFGWAYVSHDEHGEVVVDKSGDFIEDPEELETAAYDFVLESRQGGVNHAREGDSPVVKSTLIESMIFTPEKREQMGLPPGPSGWWTGWQIHDPEVWDGVKKGLYKAFSIHGSGTREKVES